VAVRADTVEVTQFTNTDIKKPEKEVAWSYAGLEMRVDAVRRHMLSSRAI
jgi:hypothetical protein